MTVGWIFEGDRDRFLAAREKPFERTSEAPAYQCPFCKHTFKAKRALSAHLDSAHVMKRPFLLVSGIEPGGEDAIRVKTSFQSLELFNCTEVWIGVDEQLRVMEITGEEVGDTLPIIHGVWADGSLEAARIAREAQVGGASALLVFPPAPFTLGQSAEMALAHFKTISDATDLPLIVFQYPLATGQGYPAATLERLFDEVPTIRAIKDWTPLVPQHESQIRALQGRDRPINVLSTNSAWLLSSLVLGCNGLLSGSGSVIADLQARLYRAVKLNDLAEARRLNDRIYPMARVFYADPFIDMHNRMKEALVLLGKLPRAVVRPPLVKITDAEIVRIRDALMEAELLGTRTALGRNAA